jgi:hypothetical protein
VKEGAARSAGEVKEGAARSAGEVKEGAARSAGEVKARGLRAREIEALREELEKKRAELVPRWNADPEDVQKSVAQLVLALVEFLRKLLERQAIRRMEEETLSPEEVEQIGVALMRLEETVHDLARQFGLDPEELNLDLGPLGRLS